MGQTRSSANPIGHPTGLTLLSFYLNAGELYREEWCVSNKCATHSRCVLLASLLACQARERQPPNEIPCVAYVIVTKKEVSAVALAKQVLPQHRLAPHERVVARAWKSRVHVQYLHFGIRHLQNYVQHSANTDV